MLKTRLFGSILFTFVLSLAAHSQDAQLASVVHTRHTINSTLLGEERTILVRVSAGYQQGEQRFPVIYMLDAHSPQNAMMVGLIEQQVWGGQMPEMIVVGIQNTNRTRDLTPTKTQRAGSGGADKFLQFLETEVMPLVEKQYRTQPFRVFAGHSLGGLAVAYALASRPDLFNAYIAASPVLHWDNNFVIKETEKLFAHKKDLKKTMFIALGNEPDYTAGFNLFKDLLKRSAPKGFEYEFQQFSDENHGSVVLRAYYGGFRKIFSGWEPPRTGSLTDLENHYKKLTERYGYTIPAPENTLNQIGYQFLQANSTVEAIRVFKRNVELYPNSANVYDSLAEAYEKNGQLKQARENFERAYKMAEAQGNSQLANASKQSFERVTKKL